MAKCTSKDLNSNQAPEVNLPTGRISVKPRRTCQVCNAPLERWSYYCEDHKKICKAIRRRDGKHCHQEARPGTDYCRGHDPKILAERKAREKAKREAEKQAKEIRKLITIPGFTFKESVLIRILKALESRKILDLPQKEI